MYVYPEMRKHLPNGEEAVKHDIDEHKKFERIMKDLEGVDATDRRFDNLVGALEATLRDHVHDEEAQHFPELRARVPRQNLVELRKKVETAKKLAPTRPHPGHRTTSCSTRSSDRVWDWWIDCGTSSPVGRRTDWSDDRPEVRSDIN